MVLSPRSGHTEWFLTHGAAQGTRKNGEKQVSKELGLVRTSWETALALKTLPQPSALHLGINAALFQTKVDALNCSPINKFVNKGSGDGPVGRTKG